MIPGRATVVAALLVLVAVSGCADQAPLSTLPSRTVVLGIDGGDWDRALPLLRQGKLPALARLTRTGTRRTLRSLTPERLSPTIWTTVATGVLPERHGIHNFVSRAPDGRLLPVTSNERKVAALWNILSARSIRVGVLGWLATWPAEEVSGYMVSSYVPYVFNWGADRPLKGTFLQGVPDQAWPPEIQPRLEALKRAPEDVTPGELGRRFTGRDVPDDPGADAAESLQGMTWSWASDDTYRRIFRHLAEEPVQGERPLVEMLYFGSVDVVSHRFWKYMEPSSYVLGRVDAAEIDLYGQSIENAYRSVDGILAEVLAHETEETTVLVLSDHGFRENRDPKRKTSSGWHRPEGLLVAEGPPFRRDAVVGPGSVVDVTPTLLYALGLPVADDMDGRVALDLFREEFRARHPVETIPSYEPEVARTREGGAIASPVDDEILSRLRTLGYLE